MTSSIWDRQRAAARDEITATANELFLQQGFDATTIDQIVERVGVSRRTFFRYFGTKEDVVLGDLIHVGERVAEALAARPADEDVWDAIRAALHAGLENTASDGLALARMLWDTPSLRSRHLEKRLGWQKILVPLAAQRLSPSPSAMLHASAIVATALACLDAASEAWLAANGEADLAELYDDAVAAVRS